MPKSDKPDQELLELQRSVLIRGATGLPSGEQAGDPDEVRRFEQRREAQREAYGQFVAADDIHLGNALVFTAGMAVPLEHVLRFNLEAMELVNRVATPQQARAGGRFSGDREFLDANPHVKRRADEEIARRKSLEAAETDPRGAAAWTEQEKQEKKEDPPAAEDPPATPSRKSTAKD